MIDPVPLLLWLAAAALEAAGVRLLTALEAPLAAAVAHGAAAAFVALGSLRHVGGHRGRAPGLAGFALALFAPPLGVAGAVAVALAAARRLPRLGLEEPPGVALDGEATGPGAPLAGFRGGTGATLLGGDLAATLLDAARFGDPGDRRAAIARLRSIPGPESFALLEAARRDPDPATRAYAARALAEVDHGLDREVAVALDEVIQSPDSAEAHALLASRQVELVRSVPAPAAARVHLLELAVKAEVRALFGIGTRFREVLVELGRALLDLARVPLVLPARPGILAAAPTGRVRRPDRLLLARRLLERAAAGPSPDPRAVVWRLEVRELTGDLDGVEADAERAARLQPEDPRLAAMAAYWAGGPVEGRRSRQEQEQPSTSSSRRIAAAAAVRAARAAVSPAAARLDLGREVAAVMEGLRSLEAPRRQLAERRMRTLVDDEAIDTLGRAMLAADDPSRIAFARHCAALGSEAAARWLGVLLRSERRWLEEAAIEGLAGVAPERKVEPLLDALASRSAVARSYAAEALAAIGARGAARPIAWLLDDERVPVVRALLRALARLGDPAQAGAVADLCGDPREEVRFRALLALGELDPAGAGTAAAPRLRDDPSARVRHAAAWAIGRSGWRGAEAALAAAAFEERDPGVLAEVLRQVAALSGPRAVPALCFAASGARGRDARRTAELAVAALPREATREALAAALRAGEPEVRRAAAALLGALGGADAVHPLVARLASEDDPEARMAAIEALGALGDPAALGPLRAQLEADDAPLRYAAGLALAELRGFEGLEALARRIGPATPQPTPKPTPASNAGAKRPAAEGAGSRGGQPFGEVVEAALLRGLARAVAEEPGREPPAELIDRAIVGLDSPRPAVRGAAAAALGAARAARAVDGMLAALASEPLEALRAGLARAIGRALEDRPQLLLLRLAHEAGRLGDEQPPVGGAGGAAGAPGGAGAAGAAGAGGPSAARLAVAVLRALGELALGPDAYEDALRRALAMAELLRRAGVEAEAGAALTRLAEREPGALLALLGEWPGFALEVEILDVLARLAARERPPPIDPGPIREALGRADPLVRAGAARTVAALRDGDSLPLLVQLLLEDPDERVQEASAAAIRAYASVSGPQEARP